MCYRQRGGGKECRNSTATLTRAVAKLKVAPCNWRDRVTYVLSIYMYALHTLNSDEPLFFNRWTLNWIMNYETN